MPVEVRPAWDIIINWDIQKDRKLPYEQECATVPLKHWIDGVAANEQGGGRGRNPAPPTGNQVQGGVSSKVHFLQVAVNLRLIGSRSLENQTQPTQTQTPKGEPGRGSEGHRKPKTLNRNTSVRLMQKCVSCNAAANPKSVCFGRGRISELRWSQSLHIGCTRDLHKQCNLDLETQTNPPPTPRRIVSSRAGGRVTNFFHGLSQGHGKSSQQNGLGTSKVETSSQP